MKEALSHALAVLAAHRHCDVADWSLGFDGSGRHQALGTFPGNPGRRPPLILLSAEDAIGVAAQYEATHAHA